MPTIVFPLAMLVLGLVIGIAATAILMTQTILKGSRSDLAALRESARSDMAALERRAQTALEATQHQARSDIEALHQIEHALQSRLTDAREAQGRAEAELKSLKTARPEADSAFAELARKIITDAQAGLAQAAAEKIKTETATLNRVAEGRLAEVTSGLTAKLEGLGSAINALQAARTEDSKQLAGQLGALGQQTSALSEAVAETRNAADRVTSLLSKSQARGAWGEYELKRLIEMTGMTEHVSFEVQQTGYGEDERGRPDVVLFIADGGSLPIDAKVPFIAYQAAVESQEPVERTKRLTEAATAVRVHIRALAQRRYHATPGCIGWTVMFVPIESMLSSVLALDPTILDYAIDSRILIASPLTLMVYLHAFAQGWSYARQQENAQAILEHAKVLVSRLTPFIGHLVKLGDRLGKALVSYNGAIGSFETSVAPQARRIHEMGGAEELSPLSPVAAEIREFDVRRLPGSLAEPILSGEIRSAKGGE
jgi:DNA recombination protein RmuC